jgi:hypothetical protein
MGSLLHTFFQAMFIGLTASSFSFALWLLAIGWFDASRSGAQLMPESILWRPAFWINTALLASLAAFVALGGVK